MSQRSLWKRVLLKLSGEALMGDLKYGIDPERLHAIAQEVCHVAAGGTEVAVVVGGGNIFRGMAGAAQGIDRATADYMGMLATVMNAMALQDALRKLATDTAAALRALEIGAECLLMAKRKFDGVYDADPETEPDARLIERITHREALERGLKVMDSTALSLCMDNRMPIMVFNMSTPENIRRVLQGERVGTIVATDAEERGEA
jgi:uridylate kinase